jgi:hypothetical protein
VLVAHTQKLLVALVVTAIGTGMAMNVILGPDTNDWLSWVMVVVGTVLMLIGLGALIKLGDTIEKQNLSQGGDNAVS